MLRKKSTITPLHLLLCLLPSAHAHDGAHEELGHELQACRLLCGLLCGLLGERGRDAHGFVKHAGALLFGLTVVLARELAVTCNCCYGSCMLASERAQLVDAAVPNDLAIV